MAPGGDGPRIGRYVLLLLALFLSITLLTSVALAGKLSDTSALLSEQSVVLQRSVANGVSAPNATPTDTPADTSTDTPTDTPTNTPTTTPTPDCSPPWRLVDSPNPHSTENVLYGADAVSVNDIWAVGEHSANRTLTLHWDGSQWSIVPSPNPDPDPSGGLGRLLDVEAV